jgi:hypothetical protein
MYQMQWSSPKSATPAHLALQTGSIKMKDNNKYYLDPGLACLAICKPKSLNILPSVSDRSTVQ